MNKYLISAVAIVAVLGVTSLAPVLVSAQSNAGSNQQASISPIVIPVDTIVRGSAGSEHVLATKTVKNGEYKVKVVSENQDSVHPDSDIIVRSSGDEVTVADVESGKFIEKTAEGTLKVTSGKVTVHLQLGKDKVFSGGVKVVLSYVAPKKVQVCDPATGEIITVAEDKKDNYLPVGDPACEDKPKQVEVCDPETGEIITVSEDEQDNYLPVDDEACEDEPEVPETPETPETPKELPKTGAGALVGGLVGSSALGLGVHSWLNSRRALRDALRK